MGRVILALGVLLLTSSFLAGCANTSATQNEAVTLYLVRHAEKEPGRDPELTPAGEVRAAVLVETLAEAQIDIIYSTDFNRTRATAAPIALSRNLPIIFYDPGDLAAFADKLKSDRRSALIVGHSNTTPELVAALGGEAGPPITEATEYDRLYKIDLGEGVQTSILRFGEPSSR